MLGLLTGLNAAAVGLIALAAFQLSKSSITDPITRLLVLGSASFGICYHAPWMYPVLVFGGGAITLLYDFRYKILKGVTGKLHAGKRRALRTGDNDADNAQNDQSQDIELEPVVTAQRASLDATDKKQTGAVVQELPFQGGSSSAQSSSLRQRTAQAADRTAPSNNTATSEAAVVDRRTPIMVLSRNIALASALHSLPLS